VRHVGYLHGRGKAEGIVSDVESVNPLAQSVATQVERRPLRLFVLRLFVLPLPLATACSGPDQQSPAVRPGIEVLATDSVHLLDGLRVGLVTNHTGRTTDGTPSAVALRRAGVDVVALFAPEHGLGGQRVGGERFGDDTDEETAVPVYSLYGDRRSPDPTILQEIDALVFDVQDVGARYYTYVSTMAAAMESAAGAGIQFVVADRPNPIGGLLVQGNVLDPEFASFVGPFPVPMRHGMTTAELALLFNMEHGIEADLHVVPASGWSRESWADETGMEWIATSPNMPTLESASHYPGTCLFEGTNVSVGRGTDRPFQQLGAPWLDPEALVKALTRHGLPGVRFESVRFTPVAPDDGKYDGIEMRGVRLYATDRRIYDPTVTAVVLLSELRRQAGDHWEWRDSSFDRLAGTDRLRRSIEAAEPVERIVRRWNQDLDRFRKRRAGYLIYP
jgi:uncharacterized protein YbbC (DUF1343 family)